MAVPSKPMAAARNASPLLALIALTACGGSSAPPPPGTPGGGGGDTITGRERIGWSQPAQDTGQLASFDYAIYVDGVRSVLTGEACSGNAAPFDCAAPLPPLTPGTHSLELASFIVSDGAVVESERSAALRVTVAASTAPADAGGALDASLTTPDGYTLTATVIARGLEDPTDLAVAPDGRAFVAERAGRVKIVGEDGIQTALDLGSGTSGSEARLTSLALHPAFERTNLVYVTHVDAAGRMSVLRFRERSGVLAEGATVARERTAAEHAVIRFGPDGLLYAALGVGADPREAQREASPEGKILRLHEDGTIPRDNPRASPVWSSGHRDPRGLAWDPATGRLWEVERGGDAGDEVNSISAGADYGWPVARMESSRTGSRAAALLMPAGTEVASADFVPLGSGSPFAGELLLASAVGEDLLRVAVDERGTGLVGGLLQGRYGRIAAVRVAADGAILLTTGNTASWGAGRDVLVRLVAAGR